MKNSADCPCYGTTLDKLVQPAILIALCEGGCHGYQLAQRINEMREAVGDKPDLSGIYRCLKKMEASGLVASSWEAGGKGHAKRLFELTPSGRACLLQWSSTLESYLAMVDTLLSGAKKALAKRPKLHKIAGR